MVATITLRPGPGFVGTTLTNTATVASLTPDPIAANNSATVTRPIARLADVAVTKSVIPTTVTAGSAVTYTITASNDGPSDAENVVVADPAVAGLTVTGANVDRRLVHRRGGRRLVRHRAAQPGRVDDDHGPGDRGPDAALPVHWPTRPRSRRAHRNRARPTTRPRRRSRSR